MAITVNIYYSGENGNAVKFAEETVLLIDSWEDQKSIDVHHAIGFSCHDDADEIQ